MIGRLKCRVGLHHVREGLYRRSCRRCDARWMIEARAGVVFWKRVR